MRRGFTVIEMLVSMAILTVLLTAMGVAFTAAAKGMEVNRNFTEAQGKARSAVNYLTSQIRRANEVHVGIGRTTAGRIEGTVLYVEVPQVVAGVETLVRLSFVLDDVNDELLVDLQPWITRTNTPGLGPIRSRKNIASPTVFVLARNVEATFVGIYEPAADSSIAATRVDVDMTVTVGKESMRLTDSAAVRRALPVR